MRIIKLLLILGLGSAALNADHIPTRTALQKNWGLIEAVVKARGLDPVAMKKIMLSPQFADFAYQSYKAKQVLVGTKQIAVAPDRTAILQLAMQNGIDKYKLIGFLSAAPTHDVLRKALESVPSER
jgi:hypothetical protein